MWIGETSRRLPKNGEHVRLFGGYPVWEHTCEQEEQAGIENQGFKGSNPKGRSRD